MRILKLRVNDEVSEALLKQIKGVSVVSETSLDLEYQQDSKFVEFINSIECFSNLNEEIINKIYLKNLHNKNYIIINNSEIFAADEPLQLKRLIISIANLYLEDLIEVDEFIFWGTKDDQIIWDVKNMKRLILRINSAKISNSVLLEDQDTNDCVSL